MKKLVIYPFTVNQQYIVDHYEKLKNVNYIGKVVPLSWRSSLTGEADDLTEKIIDESVLLEMADIILVPELDDYKKIYRDTLDEKLNFLEDKGKQIVRVNNDEIKEYNIPQNMWQEINTPVIYIGETKNGPHGMILSEDLSEKFRENGYNVVTVINEKYAEWIGEKCTPEFMNWDISAENKILMLNHFIYEIEKNEKPDVIIMQVPGNTVRLDRFSERKFEMGSYIYGQACTPDIFIQTVPINMCETSLLNKIRDESLKRFGFNIDIFWITNCFVDSSRAKYLGSVKEFYVSKNSFQRKIKEMDIIHQKYNYFNIDSITSIFNYIVDELGDTEHG